MNNLQVGIGSLWGKLIKVGKQFDRWGIGYSNRQQLPFYDEAKRSVGNSFERPFLKHGTRIAAAYPKNLDPLLVATLIHSSEHPLALNTGIILDAAKREDTDFFISLGKVLAKKKAGVLFTNDRDPTHPTVQDHVAIFWVNGLLWLMTDQAALNFFKYVLGETITLHAYKMARRRRLQLAKHPDTPIIEIELTPRPMPDSRNVSVSQKQGILRLKLKRGWQIRDGGLVAPPR